MPPEPMIPKVIHQIWIGPAPRPEAWMRTWREQHPGWEYRLWTDETLAAVPLRTRDKIPQIREINGRADVIRWELLGRYGGVFVDADSECLRPLPEEFLHDRFFACYEQEQVRPGLVACGFMGAVPGHELVEGIVEQLVAAPFDDTPAWVQFGPGLLTRALGSRPRWPGVKIHPSFHFLPTHYTGLSYSGPGAVYARHYWGSTLEQQRARREAPAPRGAPAGTLVFSPHCDDVPLSLGASLCAGGLGPGVHVVVVFSQSTFTIAQRGTAPLRETTLLRIEEERRAAAIAGYRVSFLPFAESCARPGYTNDAEVLDPGRDPRGDALWPQVCAAIGELLRQHRGPVLAPLGCATHIDHRIVSLILREHRERVPAQPVLFYEELPYAARLDRASFLSLVAAAGGQRPLVRLRTHCGTLEQKMSLLGEYRSQMDEPTLRAVKAHWKANGAEYIWGNPPAPGSSPSAP